MGLLDFLKKKQIPNLEVKKETFFESEKVGNIQIPDTLTDVNAFSLANTVTEIYYPIDFIADRASKIRYFIADKQGNEVENTELNRFINNINPLFSFSDLVYQYVFSILSDGNVFSYVKVPDNYKNINVNSITRLDILQPNIIDIQEFSNINLLFINNYNELVRKVNYLYGIGYKKELNVNLLTINKIDNTIRDNSTFLSKSPLFKAYRPINNLLAAYSARYNVYVNNGSAGYLVKKSNSGNSEQEAVDPITRETILADINSRNGITGNRNFWGISSIPLEMVNTLLDIQKLMPFDETLEDSIKIAGVYQIPSVLIPRKDQSTFNNMDVAERSVWENTITSIVDLFCSNYTKICTLDKTGYSIKADYSSVSVLKTNETAIEDLKAKQITNLKSLKEIKPELNIDSEIEKIMLSYGKQ